MVKFDLLLPAEAAMLFQNRVVCDVIEYKMTSAVGPACIWRGSVEAEYFTITFLNGILTISLSEREYQLGGENAVNYAISNTFDSLIKIAGDNAVMSAEAKYNYILKQWPKEQKEVSFTDVMVALNWTYKAGVKIDYDMLIN